MVTALLHLLENLTPHWNCLGMEGPLWVRPSNLLKV